MEQFVTPGRTVDMSAQALPESKSSPKRLAHIAGILYLLVGISGGFAEGFVYPKMYLAGDATATAGNVLANPGRRRGGWVVVIDSTCFRTSAFSSSPVLP